MRNKEPSGDIDTGGSDIGESGRGRRDALKQCASVGVECHPCAFLGGMWWMIIIDYHNPDCYKFCLRT